MLKNRYTKTLDLASMAVAFALVQFGGGVSQIRGSIDGTVFSRNRAGAIARGRTKPINPGTLRQSEVRAAFGASSASWGALTPADVADWDAYSGLLTRQNRLGESYTPKGRQVFMEINQNLQLVGETPFVTPSPFTDTPSATSWDTVTVTRTAGLITAFSIAGIGFVLPSGGAGHLIVEASPAHDPKLTNVNNLFRQVGVFVAGADPYDVEAGYIAVFGPSAGAGQVIDLRVRVIDDDSGLGSSWLLTQTPAIV